MTTMEKYIKVFTESLSLDEMQEVKNLNYQDIPEWDSVGHMELIAELEDTFDISMETDDIIDFNSFQTGIDILKKYGIIIEE